MRETGLHSTIYNNSIGALLLGWYSGSIRAKHQLLWQWSGVL